MGLVEKQKAKRKGLRNLDPHEWAEEIERRIDNKTMLPGLAFLFAAVACVVTVFMWTQQERMKAQIEDLQFTSETIEGFLDRKFPTNP